MSKKISLRTPKVERLEIVRFLRSCISCWRAKCKQLSLAVNVGLRVTDVVKGLGVRRPNSTDMPNRWWCVLLGCWYATLRPGCWQQRRDPSLGWRVDTHGVARRYLSILTYAQIRDASGLPLTSQVATDSCVQDLPISLNDVLIVGRCNRHVLYL